MTGKNPILAEVERAQAAAAEREERRLAAVAAGRIAAAPVVDDLRRAGFDVVNIQDLYNKKLKYGSAIPILLKWLPVVDNWTAKVQIVTALNTRAAKPSAAEPLIREFRSDPDPEMRSVIAQVLCRVANASVLDDLASLAEDPASGIARRPLALCLGEFNDARSVEALSHLLRDDDVGGYAVIAAGKLRARSLRPLVEPYLNHPKAWVRAEARKALARMDKASAT